MKVCTEDPPSVEANSVCIVYSEYNISIVVFISFLYILHITYIFFFAPVSDDSTHSRAVEKKTLCLVMLLLSIGHIKLNTVQ